MNPVKKEAFRLHAAGVNVLPIKTDGTKYPPLATWRDYIEMRVGPEEMEMWFGEKAPLRGLCVVCGEVSGNHIVFDGDSTSDGFFVPLLAATGRLSVSAPAELLAKWEVAPVTRTPSGAWHKHLKCSEPVGKGLSLAKRGVEVPEGTTGAKLVDGKWLRPEVLIETRGQGHIAILPPSPAACHPDRKPYVLESGDLAQVPTITPDELEILLNNCRSFNEYVKPEAVVSEKRKPATEAPAEGLRPGDDYNSRGDHESLLEKHGWHLTGGRGETELWTRPGKGHGISATFNHAGCGMFYPFSTNCDPLESEKAYRPFALYATLEHGGDFSAAAKALYAEGYGDRIKHQDKDDWEDTESSTADQECPQEANGGPEASAPEKKGLPHVLPSIARRLRGLPVTVQESGLNVFSDATDDQRRQIFKGLMRLAGDAELWLRFAIGDTYENLPGDYGDRANWARRNFPGKYHTAKNYGWVAKHWPLQIRDMTGSVPWSFYVETADACFGQTDRQELLDRWRGGEWKSVDEMRDYKKTLKPAKESKAGTHDADSESEEGRAVHQSRADDFLNILPDDFQALLREAVESAGIPAVEAQLRALLVGSETESKEAENQSSSNAEKSLFLDGKASRAVTVQPTDPFSEADDKDGVESAATMPSAVPGHGYKSTYLYSRDQAETQGSSPEPLAHENTHDAVSISGDPLAPYAEIVAEAEAGSLSTLKPILLRPGTSIPTDGLCRFVITHAQAVRRMAEREPPPIEAMQSKLSDLGVIRSALNASDISNERISFS